MAGVPEGDSLRRVSTNYIGFIVLSYMKIKPTGERIKDEYRATNTVH